MASFNLNHKPSFNSAPSPSTSLHRKATVVLYHINHDTAPPLFLQTTFNNHTIAISINPFTSSSVLHQAHHRRLFIPDRFLICKLSTPSLKPCYPQLCREPRRSRPHLHSSTVLLPRSSPQMTMHLAPLLFTPSASTVGKPISGDLIRSPLRL
jgi:hypothetical protein